jgi:hypothetical protein
MRSSAIRLAERAASPERAAGLAVEPAGLAVEPARGPREPLVLRAPLARDEEPAVARAPRELRAALPAQPARRLPAEAA